MINARKNLIFVIILLFSLQAIDAKLSLSYNDSPSNHTYTTELLDIGTEGIDWTLEDILTDNLITFSNFKGKAVLLDFFATWCTPCQTSMSEFVTLRNSFSNQELVIISISSESKPESELEDFAAEYNMNWKVVMDDINLGSFYEVTSIPTIYIFDIDLKINYRNVGVIGASTLANIVSSILDKDDTPTTTRRSGEPLDGFWVKNWYWFGILLIFTIIASVVFLQRKKVIEHNKKIHEEKLAEKRRKELKRRRR